MDNWNLTLRVGKKRGKKSGFPKEFFGGLFFGATMVYKQQIDMSTIMIGVNLLLVEPNLPLPHFNPFSHVKKGFFCDFLENGSR